MMNVADVEEALSGLEDMVDVIGLRMVLIQLAEVCELKADHIQTNWQDPILARQWHRCAQQLTNMAGRKAILSVSPDPK